MIDLHIITDSSANLIRARNDPRVIVVPSRIAIGSKTYREGIDLPNEELIKLIARSKTRPVITAPTEADYTRTYAQAMRASDAVLSIHASRELCANWYNARKAAQPLAAHSKVAVIDSRTICTAQGLLVELALRLSSVVSSFDELVRRVRGGVERLYALYYAESLDTLMQSKVLNASHSVLGTMLGIRPFLTIENGLLTPIEKVRTRAQAVDRIVEFCIEFEEFEEAVIVQNKATSSETSRLLQERLSTEFNGREFPTSVYTASLAALVGPDAHGLVILERESASDDDPADD